MEERKSVDPQTAAFVRSLIANDDPNTIEKIADLQAEVSLADESGKKSWLTLGFLILSKNPSAGVLELDDHAMLDKVNQYIVGSNSKGPSR